MAVLIYRHPTEWPRVDLEFFLLVAFILGILGSLTERERSLLNTVIGAQWISNRSEVYILMSWRIKPQKRQFEKFKKEVLYEKR